MMLEEKNKHELDSRIKFEKEGHIYWIDNDSSNIISSTTFIHSFFNKFDGSSIVDNIIKSKRYNTDTDYQYYNMSKEDILKKWEKEGTTASNAGTKLHEDIEAFYNLEFVTNNSLEYKYFLNFNESHKKWNIYRTEWYIFSEDHRITGSIDAIFENEDGTLTICDWKRSKKIKKDIDNFTKYGKVPLEHIPDLNYYHYNLQLNLYKYIIESYYGKTVRDMYLIVLYPDNEDYCKIKVEDLSKEIIDIMNNRLKNLEKEKNKTVKDIGYDNLSDIQKKAYKLIINKKNIFLTGSAGSGKSTIIKLFYENYRDKLNIGITSTTGVSAILIGGSTIHSFLGIGLATSSADKLYLFLKEKRPHLIRNRWKKLDVLIIDEVSMLSFELFEKIEKLARLIRNNSKPFGGIQLILTGDFFQLPSIGSEKLCFESDTWTKCIGNNVVILKKSFRQTDDVFRECLEKLRFGKLDSDVIKIIQSRENIELKNEFGIIPTKIYALNRDVDLENEKHLDNLLKKDPNLEFFEYELEYTVHSKNIKDPKERIKKSCVAPDTIQLCIGAQVMLIFNLDIENHLVNGSRGIVTNFVTGLPLVKFINGLEVLINHNTWNIEENGEHLISVIQIPLKIAYSTTTHKAQGQTLDLAEIDFKGIFEFGQAYTCISRVKTLEGLSVKNFNKDKFLVHPKVKSFYESFLET